MKSVKRRVKPKLGDLFLVPRNDGKFVVAQITEEWLPKIICVAVFDLVSDGSEEPMDYIGGARVIAMPSVSKTEIANGYWKVVGHAPISADLSLAPHSKCRDKNFVGASWHSGKLIGELVDAYFGLGEWEIYPEIPGRLRALLLKDLSSP